MLGGITLLGIVTASIASWLIARVRDVETTTEARLQHGIDELHDEIRELKSMVAALDNGRINLTPTKERAD